ncbi:MAG: TIGR02594 family protein [Oligoflexales bacterium]
MNGIVSQALSVYDSSYKPAYAKQCDVNIPPKANWCGVFAGWLLTKNGFELPPRPQVARSYLKVGKPVEEPQIGDLVVFWRVDPKDWRGHVSIFIREDESGIYCLGGNQQGKVQIVKYNKFKLLGYRRIQDEY